MTDGLTQQALDAATDRGSKAMYDALALHGLMCTTPTSMPALYVAVSMCDFPKIVKDKTATIRPRDASKAAYSFQYAELEQILDKVKPVLRAQGLALVQPVITDGLGQAWLVTALLHKDGGVLLSTLKAPNPTDELKEFGGSLTFVRRYMVNAMLSLASDDDLNDDPNKPGYGDHDDRRDYPAAKKAPVRRSAAPAPAAAAAPAATSAPAAGPAAVGISAGQFNNLRAKITALEMPESAVNAMLARLGIERFDASMSLDEWKAVKAELDRAAKAMT